MSTKKGIIKDVNGNPLYAKTNINLVDGFPEPRPVDMGKYLAVGDNLEYEWKDQEQGVTVIANPTLSGGEPDLTSLQVGTSKYAIEQGMTQSDADNRYLQLSGGHMTGTIHLGPGVSLRDNSGDQVFYRMSSSIDFGEKLNVNFRTDSGNKLYHKVGNNQYEILDTANTEANPTLSGTEANLTSIKIAGTNYNVPDTTYTSKSAVSGGTDVSLVTTGEKYTWNNKSDFSGNYNDLSNKPNLATVATSGSYNDLSNKPYINDATLTITQNGTSKGTFTANASSNTTIALTDTTYSSQAAAQGGTTESLVTTGEKYIWNNKQDALSTQTAYSAKGSATKVPQITTNTLGQVTGITEVTITQPPVNNATLTVTQNGTSKGTFTANSSTDTTIALTDTTYESKTAVSGGTDVSLVTTGEKYTWNNKQNALPNVVNDRYLHTNASTGALEWTQVQSGGNAFHIDVASQGMSGTITTDVANVASHMKNDDLLWINGFVCSLASRMVVSDEYFMAIYTADYYDTTDFGQVSFYFVCTAYSTGITFTETITEMPLPTSSDNGKVLSVDSTGRFVLTQQSSGGSLYSLTLGSGASGTISTSVSEVLQHLREDNEIIIDGHRADVTTRTYTDASNYSISFSYTYTISARTWFYSYTFVPSSGNIAWSRDNRSQLPASTTYYDHYVLGINASGTYARVTNAYIYYPLTLTGSSGTISTDVETVARYLTDSKQIMINDYIAERVNVETVSNVTTVKYSIVNAENLLNFQEYSFVFDLTVVSPTITWTKVYDKAVPSPTSGDVNKILTVNAQGEYVLDSITNLADVYNGQVV